MYEYSDDILRYLDFTDDQKQRFFARADQLSAFKLSRSDRHHVLIGVANRIKREGKNGRS